MEIELSAKNAMPLVEDVLVLNRHNVWTVLI